MSLDLSDRGILQQYHQLQSTDSPIDWCSFGYQRTSNQLFPYASGSRGIDQLRESLATNEVQYGLIKVEGRIVLWSLIPESVGGVKRARALVHSRSLTSILKSHHALFVANHPSSFQLSQIRSILHLPSLSSSSSPFPSQPHSRSRTVSTSHSRPSSTLSESFVSNSSTIQPSLVTTPTSIRNNNNNLNSFEGTTKGKERAVGHQESPQFDLYHEYEPPTRRQERYAWVNNGQDHEGKGEESGEEEDLPPELPEKQPRSPFPTSSLSSQSRIPPKTTNNLTPSSSTTTEDPYQPSSRSNRRSLSPPPTPSVTTDPRTDHRAQAHQGPPPLGAPIIRSLSPCPPSSDRNPTLMKPPQRPFSESPAARMMLSPTINHDADDQYDDEEGRLEGGRERNSVYHSAENGGSILEDEREVEEEAQGGILERISQEREEEQARIQEEEEERLREEEEENFERERVIRQEREEVEERLRVEQDEESERLRSIREEAEELETTLRAKEEMRLMVERERLEKKLREEEQIRMNELERIREREERTRVLGERREKGEVMMQGEVSVQASGSMLWRRRYYELRASVISFSKSQAESSKPLDTIETNSIRLIIAHPDEPLPPHSFKVVLQDEKEWLFYGDDEEQKGMLIEGLKIASRIP
ncbi:hypothetical protein JCM16303_005110 [Sporobolomyces ruberrimus]